MAVWNKLYKRHLWSNVRFPDGHNMEDVEVVFKITALCKKIYVLDKPLYKWNANPTSITHTYSNKNILDIIRSDNVVSAFIESQIPETLTPEDFRSFLLPRLKTTMAWSIRRPKGMSREEWNLARESLSQHVAELGNKIGLENCSPLLRVAYWMFWHCRWLLTVAYRYAWAPVRVAKRCWQIIKG